MRAHWTLILVAALCVSMPAVAAPLYDVIDLGTLGGPTSAAHALNSHGQVVGRAETSDGFHYAFLWEQSTGMQSLGSLGEGIGHANKSKALGINDAGQVVGGSLTDVPGYGGNWIYRGFLWEDNVMTDLGTIDYPSNHDSEALDINNSGVIVGWAGFQQSSRYPVKWEAGVIDLLWANEYGQAMAINDAGHATGREEGFAVLWWDIGRTTIGPYSSQPQDLNDLDQVTGYALADTGFDHAFLWEYGVGTTDLGTLGGDESKAYAINDHGQVVGTADNQEDQQRAFIWQDGAMSDLNDLLMPATNWTLTAARDINEWGWIVGEGINPNGDHHAFMLVPEPATMSLLALGGLAVLRRRYA